MALRLSYPTKSTALIWMYGTRISMYIVPAQRRDPADGHR